MVIALIALIVVGPEQLPSVLRKLGKQVAQIKAMTSSVRDEFMAGLDEANPANWLENNSDTVSEPPANPRNLEELEAQTRMADQAAAAERAAEEQAMGKEAADAQQAEFEAKAARSKRSYSSQPDAPDAESKPTSEESGGTDSGSEGQ